MTTPHSPQPPDEDPHESGDWRPPGGSHSRESSQEPYQSESEHTPPPGSGEDQTPQPGHPPGGPSPHGGHQQGGYQYGGYQQYGYPPGGQPGDHQQSGNPPGGQQGGYPPGGQQGGYPPQGGQQQGGYPPGGQQGGYPPQGGQQQGGYPHGGYYPPGGQPGYPPQPGQGGYPPPPAGPGGGPVASDPRDPLFSVDINGWWLAAMGVFQRSWQSIGMLMLIGVFIPSWIVRTIFSYSTSEYNMYSTTSGFNWEFAGRSIVPSLLGLVLGYLTASAWAASMRVAVIESSGRQTDFGEAVVYGFKRGLRLWGWGILAYITVAIGTVLCVLPGLWALFALSLIAPVTVFERTNSYVRSIKLTHSQFGPALGRLAIAFLVVAVYGCIASLIGGLVSAALGVGPNMGGLTGVAAFIVILVVQGVVSLLFLVPAVWLVGVILCTYTGIRGRVESVSVQSLMAEADR